LYSDTPLDASVAVDPDQWRDHCRNVGRCAVPISKQQTEIIMKTGSTINARRGLPGGGPSFMVADLWSAGANPGRRLTAENRAMLAAISTIVRFRKGETICQQDKKAVAVFNVITGMVKSYRLSPDHKKHIVGFRFTNDLVGLPENGRYVNTAEAASAVTLYKMSGSAIEATLRRHSELDFQIIGRLCHVLHDAQDHALLLSKRHAAAKLGLFLQMLETRQVDEGAGSGEVFLPMSRSDIGSYTGISAETVSRTLRTLAQHHVIGFRDRRHVQIIDRLQLEMTVSDDHQLSE
jgi:CRP/FNR family transcriptional regulator